MRVDAHQHFWRVGRGDYGWLTAASFPAIYRDHMPSELAPLLNVCGLDRTVLVQCAPTEAETGFLLELAAETEFVAGVVGWVDLSEPGVTGKIARLAEVPKLVGLRPMLQDLIEDDWILKPAVDSGLRAMIEAGLTFDALILPRHLPVIRRFLDRYPDLKVVIDHAAKPDIRAGDIDDWSRHLRRIAADTNARCKLSGLATEAPEHWDAEMLRPYADAVLEHFGPGRIMWGSDWPVLTLAGDYRTWHDTALALTASLTGDQRAAIFGGNAIDFYGLTERG